MFVLYFFCYQIVELRTVCFVSLFYSKLFIFAPFGPIPPTSTASAVIKNGWSWSLGISWEGMSWQREHWKGWNARRAVLHRLVPSHANRSVSKVIGGKKIYKNVTAMITHATWRGLYEEEEPDFKHILFAALVVYRDNLLIAIPCSYLPFLVFVYRLLARLHIFLCYTLLGRSIRMFACMDFVIGMAETWNSETAVNNKLSEKCLDRRSENWFL